MIGTLAAKLGSLALGVSESAIQLPAFGPFEWSVLYWVLAAAGVAILYGAFNVIKVMKQDPGVKALTDVATAIEEGAMAYLKQQMKIMVVFIGLIFVGLLCMYYFKTNAAVEGNVTVNLLVATFEATNRAFLSWGIALAFVAGVACSYGAGFVGMKLAVKGNVRTANAALTSFSKALNVSFSAGAVSGMFTVGFGLLGATIIFMIFKQDAMKVLVGFGFGGSLAALFMMVGGGIFTKAADVGADLVGKVEAGIPEDDPRNAATIADNVGDNVGDCAGMAADVFESYEVTLVAAIILSASMLADPAFLKAWGGNAGGMTLKFVMFALIIRAVGVVTSIVGILCVRGDDKAKVFDPMKPIVTGYITSSILSIIAFFIVSKWLFGFTGTNLWLKFSLITSIGILLSVATLILTNIFTHPDKRAVTETALASKTGPATLILNGMAEGMESSVWAIVLICATIMASLVIFHNDGLAMASLGVALSGLGLLATTGFVLAMDTFGPITDNAHGIFEMSKLNVKKASDTLAWMDAIGNTTKALTKGLAIATAVIAATALFRSFIDEAGAKLVTNGIAAIQIQLPEIFIGLMIGASVPFLFSSFALKAVGRAASLVVMEVRRQFKQHPGIMKGTEKPEYGPCVAIVTEAAQRELVGPGILAVATPVLVAVLLGVGALGGYLVGAIVVGQLMAVYMSNTGGLWDNAKKKIEDGFLGGKGTDAHKAAVIGDTVGDPFKDTAGPAINPMIKVMNLVAIILAPIAPAGVIMLSDVHFWQKGLIAVACIAALGFAMVMNRKGSLLQAEGKKKVTRKRK